MTTRDNRIFHRYCPWYRRVLGAALTLLILPPLTGLDLLAQQTVRDSIVKQETDAQARAARTAIDAKLPAARQHEAACELVLKTCRQVVARLDTGADTGAPLKDIETLATKLGAIQLATMAEWTAARGGSWRTARRPASLTGTKPRARRWSSGSRNSSACSGRCTAIRAMRRACVPVSSR